MISRREEQEAWRKLVYYIDGEREYKLQLSYVYAKPEPLYYVYIQGIKPNGWTSGFFDPMEAVDNAIAKFELRRFNKKYSLSKEDDTKFRKDAWLNGVKGRL